MTPKICLLNHLRREMCYFIGERSARKELQSLEVVNKLLGRKGLSLSLHKYSINMWR